MGQRRRAATARVLAAALLAVTLASTGLGTALAAPAEVPAPVARLAEPDAARAHHAPAQDRAALAREAEEEGEDVFLSLAPTCAPSAMKKVRTSAVVFSTRKATFGWVLTATSGWRATGTVKVKKEGVTRLKLPAVRVGGYRVVLTEKGASTPVADETFDVRRCVQAKAGCHAVRFINPAGNPSADVSYGPRRADAFDVRLAPGQSRTVRIDDKRVVFEAWSADVDVDAPLGAGSVKVRQSCRHHPATPAQNAVQTTALVGCGATGTAPVQLFWSAQKSLANRSWQVLDGTSAVVAHGSYANGRDTTVRLAPGPYTYRSFANKDAKPFEQVGFSVLRCVEVTPACRAVALQNPNDVAVEVLLLDPEEVAVVAARRVDPVADEGDEEGWYEGTLAAHGGETVPWTTTSVAVLAVASGTDETTRFVSLASPFPTGGDLDELPVVEVPQSC